MNVYVKYPSIIVSIFVWIGFVCAISFMEAWLKFRAPGMTLSLGLQVGKIVFNTLNKVEIFLALSVLITLIIFKEPVVTLKNFFFLIAFLVLFLQTTWLLPGLSDRANLIIKGMNVPSSNLHFYYIFLEAVKVISLIVYGIKQFK